MIDPSDVTAILLAAGRATRFGSDKLRVPIRGVSIAERSARTLHDIAFGRRIVVVGSDPLVLDGFEPVGVAPNLPLSASIATGVRAAAAGSCRAVLIALADMPFVSQAHVLALLAAHRGDITASQSAGRAMVPALFDRARFRELGALQGDYGARTLLGLATLVAATDSEMADIDEPADLPR